MDNALRQRVESFVKPLYQDLDGVSRFDEVERISSIARRLYAPPDPAASSLFELLLLFQGLGGWVARVGNLSRATLATGAPEQDLRHAAALLQRLDSPDSEPLIAVASALRIDEAGLRGLASRMAAARREGVSVVDVAREEISAAIAPDWMSPRGRAWFEARTARRRRYCEELLQEYALSDLSE